MSLITEHFDTIISFVKDIALVGLLGAYIKYLDYKKEQAKTKLRSEDQAYRNESAERAEYRKELDAMRKEAKERGDHDAREIKELQRQLDEWRDKYYKLFEKYTQISSSNSELRNKYTELWLTVKDLKKDNNNNNQQ